MSRLSPEQRSSLEIVFESTKTGDNSGGEGKQINILDGRWVRKGEKLVGQNTQNTAEVPCRANKALNLLEWQGEALSKNNL